MNTNRTLKRNSEIGKAATRLLQAAADYWEIYQKVCGGAAVVWVDNDKGNFVLFTRGEYRDSIMREVCRLNHSELALFEPFTEGAEEPDV